MKFLGKKNVVFFEPKSWWKDDIYWLLKSSCFELFGDEKYGLFLSQEVDGKDDIYWLRKSSCFELFDGGKYGLFWVKKLMERWYLPVTEKFLFWTFRWWEIRSFLRQKVDGKIIFTWSFLAFHDIPRPGKYDFSCSVMCLWHNDCSVVTQLLITCQPL